MLEKLKFKIQKWFALRKAKELEVKHFPTEKEILAEDKVFRNEALSIKPLITKNVKEKKVLKRKVTKKKSKRNVSKKRKK
jgi:hypothetical protein